MDDPGVVSQAHRTASAKALRSEVFKGWEGGQCGWRVISQQVRGKKWQQRGRKRPPSAGFYKGPWGKAPM